MMLLNATGLGIGRTPSNAKLEVAGEARVYTGSDLGYWGVDSGNSYVYFGTNTSGYSLSFQTAGAEKMRIVSAGAVGIDNSSPDSFNGSGSTSSSLVIGKGTSSISPQLTLWQGNSAQATINFASANTGTGQYEGRIRYTRDTGVMDFRTNGIANVLVLNAYGNVGIGVTGPIVPLHVSGAAVNNPSNGNWWL